MILYGLRLLVALLTFAFGVAAAWLFGSGMSKNCGKPAVVSQYTTVETVSVLSDAPKTRSCSLTRSPVEGGILNGKAVSKPAPFYPREAKAARVSGTVVVRVVLDEAGNVSSAVPISGPEMLRDAAADAARAARFSPTRLSGEPVKVAGTVTYNFVLQ